MSNSKSKTTNDKPLYIAAAIVLIAAAIVAALMYIFAPNSSKEDMNVGIDGVDVYYGEPINDVLARLGKPDSVSDKDVYSGETAYWYTVDAFGVKDSTLMVYGKEAEHYDNQLYMVTLTMPTDDQEALFERVREHISEQYKNREGYNDSDVSVYNDLTFCSVYTESDDYTESCGINYDSEAVELTAIYSPKY